MARLPAGVHRCKKTDPFRARAGRGADGARRPAADMGEGGPLWPREPFALGSRGRG